MRDTIRLVIVLLHGGRASGEDVRPLAMSLQARGWRAVTLSLPGHRHGPMLPENATFRRVAEAVAAAVPGGVQVVLVGHSTGCSVAFELCRVLGARVAGIVAISPFVDTMQLTGLALWLVEHPRVAELVQRVAPRLLWIYLARRSSSPAHTMGRVARDYAALDPRFFRVLAQANALRTGQPYENLEGVKVLVLGAPDDDVIVPWTVWEVAAMLRGLGARARVRRLMHGWRHNSPSWAAHSLSEIVSSFVARL